MADRDHHRLEISLRRGCRAQQRPPHPTGVAYEFSVLAHPLEARGNRPHRVLAETVDVVKCFAYADSRYAREDTEVAGEPEAEGVQDAVAVDEDSLRQ